MTNLITKAQTWVVTRKSDEAGASFAEYGLIVTLIAIFVMASVAALGGPVAKLYELPPW